MAVSQSNAEENMKMEGSEVKHMDCIQKSPGKLQSLPTEDLTEEKMLRSRVDEQSSLICILKNRADEVFLRYQALQKINAKHEDQVARCQKELEEERNKSKILEKRFMDLAANNQAIIAFMEEYKNHNSQLKLENEKLQSENESLFSQRLHDSQVLVQKLEEEVKLLIEKYAHKRKEYREKLAGCQMELLGQENLHIARETSLIDELQDAHQQHKEAVDNCKELKLQLQEAEEQRALNEIKMRERITSLMKEKDKFLCLSMERGKVIQEKQEEIQNLETKCKEEKKVRLEALERFAREVEAVNKDGRVKSLQSALDQSVRKFEKLKEDFDAFKEHSDSLLTQERELNRKLRHMIG